MGRYRKGKKVIGIRGGGGITSGRMVGLISQVIGGAFVLLALVLFGVALSQLDTAYTTANTYAGMVGLTGVMGIWGMIIFLLLVGIGVSVIAGGSYHAFKVTARGGWIEAFLGFAMGAVGLVIALILNGVVLAQLQVQMVAINATTNLANFSGLYDVSTIFGMLIFLTLVGSGASGIVAAGVAAYRNLRHGF